MTDSTEGRNYRVEGNDTSGYVGVSPEYMTYANKTEKPELTDTEKWDLGLLSHLEGNHNEDAVAEADKPATSLSLALTPTDVK